jgi:hypothetical protein
MPPSKTSSRFPIYIVSKGRAGSRLTARSLGAMGVPYWIVVEGQERDEYAAVIDPARILVLDPEYQRAYDTFDDLGDAKSRGPGPARNFAWDHAIAAGAPWHWVMDDNIQDFHRFNHNLKVPVSDGAVLVAMEDWALRWRNLAMVGPNYFMFAPRKQKPSAPVKLNTRIYSCNLIRNDVPFRWRGRYNEDTDLSLRMLKAGWCTALFQAFLQYKLPTQQIAGGNTDAFYAREGTFPKSRMLVEMHPDVARQVIRFGRDHHFVDYRRFESNRLVLRPGVTIADTPNEYGMRLQHLDQSPRKAARRKRAG